LAPDPAASGNSGTYQEHAMSAIASAAQPLSPPTPHVSSAHPLSTRTFREVMGRFATGVTVITTTVDDQVYGMTANAFMAGSLEPMLCVISVNRSAQMHVRLRRSGRFGVSVLNEWQQHLSAHFGGRPLDKLRPEFSFLGSTPVIARAIAALAATVVDTAECGDHTLFIGRLSEMATSPGRPLLFYGGRYAAVDSSHGNETVAPPEFW
jgi:flavin reductase (DIM6/NTAB) family NADH-FMN oxidoreductase RutF